ncbi:O-acetylhomoserine aminocarboxypropyltransferase [Alkalispirochaeta sphaeroplastigenens]|uniref:O-acetylhomoserine aminocarboxypropyltransferase n=1 Tax=Alkalispirochaeta sphaeroplastigenens TaxID=1187066 RepID=A0A2S4JJE1_9SPIO|nr:aminotransferase class I/II-fold pyridoxal phosphate-dependent enzyme [Alkalispirochaeta sphaeroplastigenens]POQ99662.1 O-acetylhomoserine aminocarboxypropyltransferase [Alkalispirochaeta sphaeroplastigenens]
MNPQWKKETRAIQGGYRPGNAEPRVTPIYQSTTYKYDTAEAVAHLFDHPEEGHIYSRISNPTTEVLQKKLADLEGGIAAVTTSSGQAATTLAILNLCQAGDHIVASSSLYGGTYNLFNYTLPRMGIEVTFVDQDQSAAEIEAAFRPRTKAIFGESISNPAMEVLDFEKFSQVARSRGVPFLVDNTFPTPFLCQPLKLGAHIVIHSTTKYIDGHATSVGGAVIDGGTFPWDNGNFPAFTEPDPSYHGVCYHERFASAAYAVKLSYQLIRDLGTPMSPMNAFLTNLGLETLHLRMERHSQNALALAQYLQDHPRVSWVRYPGLPGSPSAERARRYLPKGSSGVLTFGITGGQPAGEALMNSLELASIVVHVADVRTCVLHPASMTHRQLCQEEQQAAGVSPDLIRVSLGLEHIDDIIADFDQAFRRLP